MDRTILSTVAARVFVALLSMSLSEMAAAATAGTFDFVLGDVRVRAADGSVRAVRKGDRLNEGERVITGAAANAQIRMVDSAYIAVRPNTELDVKTYQYSGKNDGSESAMLSLLNGTMRAFTGAITRVKRDNFAMVTPTATIGIRGSGNVLHVSPELGTLNHTIEGSHAVTGLGSTGQSLGTIITRPGQTVQVMQNQSPIRIPTPQFLVQAATSKPGPGPQTPASSGQRSGQGSGSGGAGGSGGGSSGSGSSSDSGSGSGGSTGSSSGSDASARTNAGPDAALNTAVAPTTSLPGPTTTVSSPTPTTTLTGTTDAGTINTSTGTLTTNSGTTVPLTSAVPVSLTSSNGYSSNILAMKSVAQGVEALNASNTVAHPGTSFLFDDTNNLTDVLTNDELFAYGYNYQDTTTSTSSARYIRFVGGTAADTYIAPNYSVALGRWQGGSMNIYSDAGPSGGTNLLESIPLGATSAHWIGFEALPLHFAQTLTGTRSYSLIASTHPTDSFGNVGTLNSATLAANFSAQAVQVGVNLSFSGARVMTIAAQTPFIPMNTDGSFFTDSEAKAFAPTITCTGGGCIIPKPGGGLTTNTWHGGISGGFAGPNASGGGFLYSFEPDLGSPSPNTPFADLVQGVAAFTTGTAPTVGVHPTQTGASGDFRMIALYPVTGEGPSSGTTTNIAFANVSPVVPVTTLPASAFLFDASGNLVRVLGSAWNVSANNTSSQCVDGAPCLSSPPPVSTPSPESVVNFSISGATVGALGTTYNALGDRVSSTATETYNSGNGIRLGRYQGGIVNATDLSSGQTLMTDLGSNSLIWAVREAPVISTPLTGSYHYLPTFATAPTDSLGHVGTFDRAGLDVNFSTNTLNPYVRITIDGQNIDVTGRNVPIAGNSFQVSSSSAINASFTPAPPVPLSVSCVGSCPALPIGVTGSPYGARISGGFSGDNTDASAFMRYTINTRYDVTVIPGSGATGAAPLGVIPNNAIQGLVAFNQGPQFQAPTNPGKSVATSFFYWPGATGLSYGSNDQLVSLRQDSAPDGIVSDVSGNLISAAEYDPGNPSPNFLKLTAGTASLTPSGLTTTANGISFGRYAASSAVGNSGTTTSALTADGNVDSIGSFGPSSTVPATPAINMLGTLQWITAPQIWPFYITSPMTGTGTYTNISAGSSLPTDQNGVTGTLSSATLAVNFDQQFVNAAVTAVVPAANGSLARTWTATANQIALQDDGGFRAYNQPGVNPIAHVNVSVSLATPGATPSTAGFGAITGGLSGSGANGAYFSYAFAADDANNSFSHEHVNGVAAFGNPVFSNPLYTTASVPMQPYVLRLGTAGTISGINAATGALQSSAPVAQRAFSIDSEYLTTVSGEAINPANMTFDANNQVIAFRGDATIVAVNGTCPGQCDVSRIPAIISIDPASVAGAATILNAGRDRTIGASWGRYSNGNMLVTDAITNAVLGGGPFSAGNTRHFIMTGSQTGPTVLPLTGSATYTFVGGTNPTDQAGNVGTLNSATLSANFAAQTVNTVVNATVGGNTWAASANNVAIQQGIYFEARNMAGSGNMNLSCTGSCTGTLNGQVAGAFIGTTGQGAGIAYSFNAGGGAGQTIAGVAAFKR